MVGCAYVFLDVRTPAEFLEGHAPKAVNIPWALGQAPDWQLNGDFVAHVRKRYCFSQRLLVACRSGGRSHGAACALEAAGFGDLAELITGLEGTCDSFGRRVMGWRQRGLPMTAEPGEGVSYQEVIDGYR